MQFAFPPRKNSNPPPYAGRSPRTQTLRRGRLQFLALIALGVLTIFYILPKLFSGGSDAIPAGTPPVVIVTMFDRKMDQAFVDRIKKNRQNYAKQHGYKTFFPYSDEYTVGDSPKTWAKVPAMRHVLTLNPYSTYFWYLDAHALIMNPSLSLEKQIMNKDRMEELMISDIPVVPPDSVIKTFKNLKGDKIDIVLTQDRETLCQNNFIIRRGDWAKFFLDVWFDPLYRSYNFQRAEGHALEHIVQWHGTILAKLALVPQRTFNSYNTDHHTKDGRYKDGDFVINFTGCDKDKRDCQGEMASYFAQLDGHKSR